MKQNSTFNDPSQRLWVGLLAVAALVVAGFLVARPLARRSREVRLARFVEQGESARRERRFGEWWAHLLAAKELAPADPRVLRGFAGHLTHFRRSGGLAYWKALEQLGGLTRDDRLQWARLALALERTDLAREALLPLHAENSRDPAVLGLISELFELDGDLGRARVLADRAAAVAPSDAAIELRLAALELNTGPAPAQARGKARLLGLLAGRSPVRAEAGFLFLQRAGGSAADRRLLRQLLGSDSKAPFAEQLLALALQTMEQPDEVGRLAGEFADRHQLRSASPRLAYAAEQLGRLGEPRLVLELVPEGVARQDGDLCRLRLGALAATGGTGEMERLLAQPGLPLPEFARTVFEAGVAQVAGRTNAILLLWPKAIAACAEQPGALTYLARHAESVGAQQVAIEAWQAQLADTFLAPKAAVEMLRLAGLRRDYLACSVALRRLADLRPAAWDVQLSLAFSQLLLNLPDPATRVTLAMEPSRFASPDFFQVVRALQLVRDGQPDQAVGVLEQVKLPWPETPLSWRVVRVAALGRAGQNSLARKAATDLARAELSAPEMTLVESWLPRPER